MNLKKGTITVPPDEPEVVQHICLAFVTATLYLLVQPRPPKIEEVTTSPSHNHSFLRNFRDTWVTSDEGKISMTA